MFTVATGRVRCGRMQKGHLCGGQPNNLVKNGRSGAHCTGVLRICVGRLDRRRVCTGKPGDECLKVMVKSGAPRSSSRETCFSPFYSIQAQVHCAATHTQARSSLFNKSILHSELWKPTEWAFVMQFDMTVNYHDTSPSCDCFLFLLLVHFSSANVKYTVYHQLLSSIIFIIDI